MLYFAYGSNLNHFQMKRRCKDSIYIKNYNLKDFKGAINDYTKAIKLGDNGPRNYFNRGLSKRLMEDSKGACEDWKKAAELGHKDAEELLNKYCS